MWSHSRGVIYVCKVANSSLKSLINTTGAGLVYFFLSTPDAIFNEFIYLELLLKRFIKVK